MSGAHARGGRGGSPAGPADVGPWLLLAAAWSPLVLAGVLWSAGCAASWAVGSGWSGPRFGWAFLRAVARGDVAAAWPGVPPAAIAAVTAGEALVLAAVCIVVVLLWHHAAAPRQMGAAQARSLATPHDVAALTPSGVHRRALALRPSLAERSRRRVAGAECGVGVGRLATGGPRPPLLRASWEDVLLAVMAPRAGKTTSLAVPAVLEAPGAVIATSNKADLWASTVEMRGASTGQRCWVFDPQQIIHAPQDWWWNPLRGVSTVEEAHRLAGHFVQEVRGQRGKDFWTSAAHDLLTSLLLAAGVARLGLAEVYAWLNDPASPEPAELLRAGGFTAAAASLRGRQHGAADTRDGVYETARTAAQCLRDPAIMAWVTRPATAVNPTRSPQAAAGTDAGDGAGIGTGAGVPQELDAAAVATSRQTLYLLSRDGAGAAAPLVAALTDRVIRDAVRAAERRGGRLDPPMLVVLDEAANVCRISDLPDLYSHLGSRGIVPVTILQSYRQGTRVWGESGMDALWSASTCKIIGSGLDDAKVAEDISRLVGDHDVATHSTSRSRGQVTTSTSWRSQRILAPDAVRAMPRGSALLLATGARAAVVTLTPWHQRPGAALVSAAVQRAERVLTERAALSPAGAPAGVAVDCNPGSVTGGPDARSVST